MSWTHERARVASLSRSRPADDPDLLDARRNLKAERLADHIAKVVSEAPPLTPEQRDRLAVLLRTSSPPGSAPPAESGGSTSTGGAVRMNRATRKGTPPQGTPVGGGDAA